MSDSEPPPPPAPPPPGSHGRFSSTSSLISSLFEEEDDDGSEDSYAVVRSGSMAATPMWQANTDINWQERCFQLELSLQRFRDQAARIRELLREKLSEMEKKVGEAEARAKEAEEKARLMEQRIPEGSWSKGHSPDHSCATESSNLPNAVSQDKDKVISSLEQQVEEQKKLRVQDAKQIEAKAAKIKEWVTNKLKELEEQNQHLREQNQKCNEQLELLKSRMVQINQLNPRPKPRDRASNEDSFRGSFDDRNESDDGLLQEGADPRFRQAAEVTNAMTHSESAASLEAPTDPLYAAVDYSKKKAYTRSAPPRVKIERKRFQENQISPLSSMTSEDIGDTDVDARIEAIDDDDPLGIDDGGAPADGRKKPVPPPRSRATSKQRFGDNVASPLPGSPRSGSPASPRVRTRQAMSSGAPMMGTKLGFSATIPSTHGHTGSALAADAYGSLDRKLDSQRRFNLTELHGTPERKRNTARADNELHDYAEIYTPSQEIPSFIRNHAQDEVKPPTPPLHRFPSWESRIYEVAVNGISVSQDSLNFGPTGSPNNNNKSTSDNHANGAFTELNIPVYATVKGLVNAHMMLGNSTTSAFTCPGYLRASQIRSMPFTGDSSDSSDNEDTRVTVTTTSSHTTSGETESSMSTGSPSKSGKTGSSLSPSPAKQGCASPTKSVKRDTSVESALSDDYAIPPDAISSDTISIDSVEPQALRVMTILESPKKESLEKSGFLTKLGGKLKTWRRRWFVLKNGTLSYYKSQSDVNRKPQGQITLDEVCRVSRAEGAATFEISTGKRTYYLTADSINTMEEWIKVLQNVLRRNATRLLLSRGDNKPTIEGWLMKVKHGHSRRCWCVLIGRMFLYFKTPNDTTPLGQINMRDARVEEVVHVSDSDEEDQGENVSKSEYTVGIFPNHQGPTYLLMSSKQEMDAWLYHLTVVSSGDNLVGTQFEQLIAKLMEVDGDENSVIWRHPLLLHSKETITQPLTTLASEQLQSEAIKLYKSIQLFISVPLDASGIDYHVALAQNALQQCLIFPELQNELFCQLIKLTSRHSHQKLGVQVGRLHLNPVHDVKQLLLCATQSLFLCDSSTTEKTSPTSVTPPERPPSTDSKLNPPSFVFVQGYQLLALAISLFNPKNRTLWYLRTHLQRNAEIKTEAGKYAVFCQRALERALAKGGRECKPSRMEVLSILLKNPYHHSLPHSIPVHFLNGSYQVVGFDGSTTVEEFIQTLNAEAGIRDAAQSGFALFSDDPIEKSLEHSLQNSAKLCDVISRWEQALREKHLGKFENTRVIKLTYKNRLCFRQLLKAETDKERLLTAYQINEEIVQGRFPLSKELSLELAALMAQIELGDYNGEKIRGSGAPTANPQHQLQQVLEKFFPARYKEPQSEKQLLESIRGKWIALKGRSVLDCVRIYLNCARKWSYCGAKLFSAKLRTGDNIPVWLAVTEDSITLLDSQTMQALGRYPYQCVMTFGGCREDFMLVVSPLDSEMGRDGQTSERLLFAMPKPKILEITLLIADYMNALGRNTTVPPSPEASTLSRLEKIRAKIRATSSSVTMASTAGSIATGVPMATVVGSGFNESPDIVKMATEADGRGLNRSDSKKRAGSDST